MGGIYELRHWDDLTWHGSHNRFREYIAGIQKFVGGGVMLETHRQQGDLISLLRKVSKKKNTVVKKRIVLVHS
jgi:hypothetical protein